MCELFGFSSAHKTDIRAELREFFRHGVEHPHGWGLMREHYGNLEVLKEPVSSAESNIISGIIQETSPQNITLAHIRLATIGSIKLENCHPYVQTDNSGRIWTLMHNGTIYSGKKLMKYADCQIGETDSERISLALLDEINEKQPKTAEQRFQLVDEFVILLSKRNKLNLMLYDGEVLYIHQNMKNTLHYLSQDKNMLFSTKPLDNRNWIPYPLTQLNAFHAGEKVFEGRKHGYLFTPALESITERDAMHI